MRGTRSNPLGSRASGGHGWPHGESRRTIRACQRAHRLRARWVVLVASPGGGAGGFNYSAPKGKPLIPPSGSLLIAFAGLAACGGHTAAAGAQGRDGGVVGEAATDDAQVHDAGLAEATVQADAGSAEDGGGGGAADVGVAPFADATTAEAPDAASGPQAGSPACEDGPCILCSDGYYHCHSFVFSPCPGGISASTDCVGYGIPSYGCFSCPSGGSGDLWQCTTGDGQWSLTAFDCTP